MSSVYITMYDDVDDRNNIHVNFVNHVGDEFDNDKAACYQDFYPLMYLHDVRHKTGVLPPR
jgi:hypothetical protein